jgi:signal-transduction protein with cAMP-binding, CBS, and nucleotidyltransferase domain
MRERPSSSVIVTSPEGRPIGILTEQDVTRRVAFQDTAAVPVEALMSSPLHFIHDDDYLFRGIALMHRHRLRHLPVVDGSGKVVGILDLHNALASAVARGLNLIDRLTHEETLEGLLHVKKAQVEVADALLEDRVPAVGIQSLLTHINNDIYRRIIALILREFAEEGWGEPPATFGVIVMGSVGRGESFLYPDQDYGFILEDYQDRQQGRVDAYFVEMAERMSRMLEATGFPTCRGGVMAKNPLWRKTLSQWREQVSSWLERSDDETLRFGDIFFDFQHVFGDRDYAVSLRHHVTGVVRENHVFLRQMQRVQQDHGVALGVFGKLDPEDEKGPNRGKLNLKYRGLLPLVEAVRLLALREGVAETSTLERIAGLHEMGVVSRNEQDYLGAAFHHLTDLLLRQQIHDFQEGLEVGPCVSHAGLSEREKRVLADSLRVINELRNRVRAEFTAEII